MCDNNSDLSTRNKTSNGRVMCFVLISTMITNNIHINYTRRMHNVGFRYFDAAPFENLRRPWEPRHTVWIPLAYTISTFFSNSEYNIPFIKDGSKTNVITIHSLWLLYDLVTDINLLYLLKYLLNDTGSADIWILQVRSHNFNLSV